jgi:hypothetical protein
LLGEGEGGGGVPSPPWDEAGSSFAVPLEDEPSIAAVPPPGSLDGTPLRWRGPAPRYGTAEPAWLSDGRRRVP